ncbi:MAG: XdhC family protein, partial [Chloroflexota bacterium]
MRRDDRRPRRARGARRGPRGGRHPGRRGRGDPPSGRYAVRGARAARAGGGGESGPGVVVRADGTLAAGTLGEPAADATIAGAARSALADGRSRIVALPIGGAVRQVFIESYPARPRLVVVGAVQVAIPLVEIAHMVGYDTVVIDGRAAFATRERFPDVDVLVIGCPDEVADEIG